MKSPAPSGSRPFHDQGQEDAVYPVGQFQHKAITLWVAAVGMDWAGATAAKPTRWRGPRGKDSMVPVQGNANSIVMRAAGSIEGVSQIGSIAVQLGHDDVRVAAAAIGVCH